MTDPRHLLRVGTGPGLGRPSRAVRARGIPAEWAICHERPDAWREEYRFAGGAYSFAPSPVGPDELAGAEVNPGADANRE